MINQLNNYLNYRPVTIDDLKMALTMADPEIEQAVLDKYVLWAFRADSQDKLQDTESQPFAAIVERLQNGNIKRVGKK